MGWKLKSGDLVFCKIKGNSIVSSNSLIFDTQLSFKIIALDFNKYMILVPKYYNIKNSWSIVEEHVWKYNLDLTYLDQKGIMITPNKITRIKTINSQDGMFCSQCNDFYSFAEPNQEDGTLKCWRCRN